MRYDIHTTCPLCGQSISWINGKTNSNVVIIKTKRKTTNLYHESCIDQERKHNKRGLQMAKAYINGTEVVVYEYRGEEVLCYIPALDIKGWYKQNLIEVRHD